MIRRAINNFTEYLLLLAYSIILFKYCKFLFLFSGGHRIPDRNFTILSRSEYIIICGLIAR